MFSKHSGVRQLGPKARNGEGNTFGYELARHGHSNDELSGTDRPSALPDICSFNNLFKFQVDAIHPAPSQQASVAPTSQPPTIPPPSYAAATASLACERSYSPEGDSARGAGVCSGIQNLAKTGSEIRTSKDLDTQ